ncbi:hypothetical protein [Biomaibacter acetigenes]|nr:hypothetical protein [Biomaibacter acetigenes]
MTKRNPVLPRNCVVNAAGIRGEGYRSYPGRSGGNVRETNNPG